MRLASVALVLALLLATPLLTENLLKCGTRRAGVRGTFRNVRSKELEPGAWPWQVSLEMVAENKHFCGGTILNEFWVITAAHCFLDPELQNLKEIIVVLGLNKRLSPENWALYSNPHDIILHESFDEETGVNDLALIRMKDPIQFGLYTWPVCFPDNPTFNEKDWEICMVTGWMKMGEESSDTLQETSVFFLPFDECNSKFYNGMLTQNMMCVDFVESDTATCHINTGGPMVCQPANTNRWFLIGVVNWVSDCDRMWPGVITLTKSYLEWVENTTAKYGARFVINRYGSETDITHQAKSLKMKADNFAAQMMQNYWSWNMIKKAYEQTTTNTPQYVTDTPANSQPLPLAGGRLLLCSLTLVLLPT
ncbi:putative serine protease 45 [Callorhinchus milii]|uniref:putative serine protease 45 n=1 Tax=Callorhinchus milii TaxID=7868 RepID=UPI000457587A|nr:putative serine protease 45 [Callorhinchus milii]|eukprot:gi/632963268/ref/XP_007897785.1/ PREDICTED: serine protease 45-like [Callorhinchus milii]